MFTIHSHAPPPQYSTVRTEPYIHPKPHRVLTYPWTPLTVIGVYSRLASPGTATRAPLALLVRRTRLLPLFDPNRPRVLSPIFDEHTNAPLPAPAFYFSAHFRTPVGSYISVVSPSTFHRQRQPFYNPSTPRAPIDLSSYATPAVRHFFPVDASAHHALQLTKRRPPDRWPYMHCCTSFGSHTPSLSERSTMRR